MNYIFFLKKQCISFAYIAVAFNLGRVFAMYYNLNYISPIPTTAIITFAMAYIFIGAYTNYYYNNRSTTSDY